MTVPNVLATRYAGEDLVRIWSPEHKIVLERQLWIAVLRAQRDLGVDVPDGVDRGLRGRRRQGRPRVDRRARAGHPARREGPDRGVQRTRRARAHPQGDDLARPDRERRAAPGRSPRCSCSGTAPSPCWPGSPGWPPSTRPPSWPAARTTWPPRRPRSASGSPPSPTRCWSRWSGSRTCWAATRCVASRGRWAPPRTCSTCWTATRPSWPTSSSGSPPTSASGGC